MSVLIRLINIACLIVNEVGNSAQQIQEDEKHRNAGTGPYSPEAIEATRQENARRAEAATVKAIEEKIAAEKIAAEKAAWTWQATPRPIAQIETDRQRIASLEDRATRIVSNTLYDKVKLTKAAILYGGACELREAIGEDVENESFPYGQGRKFSFNLYRISLAIGMDAYGKAFKHGTLYMHEEDYDKFKSDPIAEVEYGKAKAYDYLW